jgi:hypothetical protein
MAPLTPEELLWQASRALEARSRVERSGVGGRPCNASDEPLAVPRQLPRPWGRRQRGMTAQGWIDGCTTNPSLLAKVGRKIETAIPET